MSTDVLMPAFSPTMTTGNIVKWHVKAGDKVTAGAVICEIETDKSIVELEAEVTGVVTKILVEEGAADVPVNTVLATIAAS